MTKQQPDTPTDSSIVPDDEGLVARIERSILRAEGRGTSVFAEVAPKDLRALLASTRALADERDNAADLYDAAFKARWFVAHLANGGGSLMAAGVGNAKAVEKLLDASLSKPPSDGDTA